MKQHISVHNNILCMMCRSEVSSGLINFAWHQLSYGCVYHSKFVFSSFSITAASVEQLYVERALIRSSCYRTRPRDRSEYASRVMMPSLQHRLKPIGMMSCRTSCNLRAMWLCFYRSGPSPSTFVTPTPRDYEVRECVCDSMYSGTSLIQTPLG